MGNIFSKKEPLKESLIKLETKINEFEKRLKNEKNSMQVWNKRTIYFIIFFVLIGLLYSYIDEQSFVLFGAASLVISLLVRFLILSFYRLGLESLENQIEGLKEKQKEQIEILKKEESFDTTKRLIDKYDNELLRRSHFSRINQRNRSMTENVADFVLGDDPSKMYALICKKCHYHNGMVHPSEYDLSEFYCYNCDELNQRPYTHLAPKAFNKND